MGGGGGEGGGVSHPATKEGWGGRVGPNLACDLGF